MILENQQLQHENKQVNALLKEYEVTLETVMGKFRGVAVRPAWLLMNAADSRAQHASQQHDLSLHSYYTSLLQSLQTAHSAAQLHDDTSLSLLLARLSTLLRSALRSMGGEDADNDDILLALRLALPNGSANSDDSSPPSPTRSTSSGKKSSGGRSFPHGPSRLRPFEGFQPGATGGYSGTDGQKDWALEREMEIQRLEEENKALREMLAIAEESVVAEVIEEEIQEEEKPPESPVVSRKGSLTVEELEAGAEQEAAAIQEHKRAVEAGEIDEDDLRQAQGTDIGAHDLRTPGTGLGGGGGVGDGLQRPILNESVLGFTAVVPPPEEAIDDRPEVEGEAELEADAEA